MKWYEIKDHRPPHGELIWVWNSHSQRQELIRYWGSEEHWIECKGDSVFPLWAYLNEKETEDECCEECWNEKVACTCMSKDE